MPRSAEDFRRSQLSLDELEAEVNAEKARIKAAKDRAEAEAKFKVESKRKVSEYVSLRAQQMIETGQVSPKVMGAYFSQHDLTSWDGQVTYIKAVRSLLSNALYGLSKTASGYRYNETDYPSVKAVYEAIRLQLGGIEIEAPSSRWFELALVNTIKGVKDEHMVGYRLALEPIQDAPEDVTFEDYSYLEQLGLAEGLFSALSAPTVITA